MQLSSKTRQNLPDFGPYWHIIGYRAVTVKNPKLLEIKITT